jgi:hypothetical protein
VFVVCYDILIVLPLNSHAFLYRAIATLGLELNSIIGKIPNEIGTMTSLSKSSIVLVCLSP